MAGGETCTAGTEGGDVLQRVARIQTQLAAAEKDSGTTLELLRRLQTVPMTFEALEVTKIGWAVNTLRKNASSEQAREMAAELYSRWKALADEHFWSTMAKRPPAAPAPTTGDAAAKPRALTSKTVTAACPEAPTVAKSVKTFVADQGEASSRAERFEEEAPRGTQGRCDRQEAEEHAAGAARAAPCRGAGAAAGGPAHSGGSEGVGDECLLQTSSLSEDGGEHSNPSGHQARLAGLR
ncbi:hypothetical protein ACP70R_022046 [Stipagrostis hirtigluma subsp. patula]